MECVKLYLVCLVMMACVYGTFSSNCSTALQDTDACYTSRGFPAPSQQTTPTGLSLLTGLKNKFGADICSSKQSDFLESVKCALQLSQDCASEVAAILPSVDQVEEMVNFECEQRAADVDCISKILNAQDIITCIENEAKKVAVSLGTSNLTQIVCGTIDNSFKICMLPAVEKCGCAAVNYMAKFATGSLRPMVCGASTLNLDPGSCDGGAAIVAHPVMLFLGLFAIMIKFYVV